MKKVEYESPQIQVFQVVETVSILAGSGSDTTFSPSVTPRREFNKQVQIYLISS